MLTIYKASAGSGKTFTLAYEYIKMLLGVKNKDTGRYSLNRKMRDRHRHILAVTFTNKATDEMKRRIIHELAVLGGIEPNWTKTSPYEAMLCTELNCSPDELREASASALRQLLFDFNSFQVSTIDSFFQSILRTFAREADIAGNYEVDLDNDRAIGHGVHELFDSLQIDSHSPETRRIIHWITQYLLDELSDGRQISLFNRQSKVHARFISFIKNISNDEFARNYKPMMEYLSDPNRLKSLAQQLISTEEAIKADTCKACDKAVETICSRNYDPDPTQKGKSQELKVTSLLFKQLNDVAQKGEETGSRSSAAKALNDISTAYKKKLRDALDADPDPALDADITNACRAIVENSAKLKLYRKIRANIFVLGLLERVYFHINNYRNDNNTIFLSDTNTLLREIIGEEKDNGAPFVYERIGVWINHYLIDEFQDTSKIQWENLSPLLHEGQSEENDSLIIGDEKQCIYRFRFSDPTLLQSGVGEAFPLQSQTKGKEPSENTNWRSSRDVVNFNNQLFENLARITGFEEIYDNVRQNVSPKHLNHRGYIKIARIEAKDETELKQQSLQILTDDIARQLTDGYRPCDITILTRFNQEAADVISHLMEQAEIRPELKGLRIMSDDAMAITSAPAVRLIISILRYIAMPQAQAETDSRPTSRRRALKREIGRMVNHFEHLVSCGADNEDALRLAIEKINSEEDDTTKISAEEEIAETMACFNLPSLIEHIVGSYLSEEMKHEQNMYVSAFVDTVTDFCSRGTSDIHAFLKWWDETGHRSKISAPFDEKAIRIMTIHKSKGLEFKCVHIPFANWKMVSFKGLEWFNTNGNIPGIDPANVPPMIPLQPSSMLENTQFEEQYLQRCREQLLDELNVLYVALTRAADELSVILRQSEQKTEPQSVNELMIAGLDSIEMDRHESEKKEDDSDQKQPVVFSIGKPTLPGASEKEEPTALEPRSTSSMEPYTTLPRKDLWDKLEIDRQLDYSSARERGILLHDVLAGIHHSSDLDKSINRMSYRSVLPPEEAEEIRLHLRNEFNKDHIAPWFDGFQKAICERDIVVNNTVLGRPDRIVWTADGHIDIIDYKFGVEKPKLYARQVNRYMEYLRSMGYDNVRGFIWYVDSGKITPVQ